MHLCCCNKLFVQMLERRGPASDIQILRDSEFTTFKYHWPGDQVLADRGFTLGEGFASNSGAELIIPAFIRGKKQLSAAEVERTRKISISGYTH